MSRNCPVCDYNQKTELLRLCNNMKIMGSQFPATGSNYVQCKKCGTVYVEADFTQEHWDDYYASGFSRRLRYSELFGADPANEYYQGMYDVIAPHINENSHILDMGACARGEFAKFLMEKGHKNVLACDIAPYAVEDAKKLGVNAFVSKFVNNDPELKGKFNLITLIHSFAVEHIFALREAISAVKSMLAPDGFVFLDIPDAEKYCDIEDISYFFFTYEHLQHFSGESLYNFEKAFGLKLLDMTRHGKVGKMIELYAIFENSGVISDAFKFETKSSESIVNYNKTCSSYFKTRVKSFENTQEPLALWGIGASTEILLNHIFDKCNVAKLIDSNPHRQGIEFLIADKKLRIEDPEAVRPGDTILILPAIYKEVIANQIRELGINNKVAKI